MPPNGTCTSAPAVCELTWMIPAWISLVKRCVSRRSRVKIAAERPKRTAFARSIASSKRRVAVERGHRPEDLLAGELGVVGEPLEDGRRDEVAVVVGALAAREHRAAVAARRARSRRGCPPSRPRSRPARPRLRGRPDRRPCRPRRARAACRGTRRRPSPRRGCAASRCTSALPTRRRPRMRPRPRGRAPRRRHDQRVVSAELELDAAVAGGRLVAHRAADRHRAGERDRPHARVRDDLRADLRAGAGERRSARPPAARPRRSTPRRGAPCAAPRSRA